MKAKVKLVAIAKNEAAYLPQWIHHHFSIGFNEIEIFINDTTDNSVARVRKRMKLSTRVAPYIFALPPEAVS